MDNSHRENAAEAACGKSIYSLAFSSIPDWKAYIILVLHTTS